MKTLALATTGSLLLAGTASADFVNVDIVPVNVGGANGDTWQVYANFTEADVVTALVGTENDALFINSLNAAGDGPGTGFFNSPAGSDTPIFGFFYDFDPASADADTYLTIGLQSGSADPGDAAAFSPGFQAQLGGLTDSFSAGTPNGTLFVTPDQAQAQAQPDGDGGFRVLLANITVAAGENIEGAINIQWATAAGGGGGLETGENVFFTTVPAPGALALLGLAGLAGTRRRRA